MIKKKQSALHVVSAWASEHRLLLGQVKVEDNEIKAIPSLGNSTLPVASSLSMPWTQTEIATRLWAKAQIIF